VDPALASIIGTTILGGCSIVVAIITGRTSVRKAVDEATGPLHKEIARLEVALAAATGTATLEGVSDDA
jgi:uncharacterized protein (UPF0147 family)